MTPRLAEHPRKAAVLAACLGGCTSFREVASKAGVPLSSTFAFLLELRRQGMVDWEKGKAGTLRATCRVLPVDLVQSGVDIEAPPHARTSGGADRHLARRRQ